MRGRVVTVIAIALPCLWCCSGALFHGKSFGFRDSAHYYYPLFHWQQQEWRAGRIPLWNAYENLGVPQLAETTSSVFYPGKLLFWLPTPFATNFKLYVMAHLLVAATAAYGGAKFLGCRPPGATLAAVAYAYGGHVLFQYTNVVYLVSAAWMPVAMIATDRLLLTNRWRWAVMFGAIMALMVLGGDPQTAYHAGLLAIAYAWLLRKRRGVTTTATADPQGSRSRVFTALLTRTNVRRGALIGCSAVSAFLLAAIQFLPALQWTSHSDRSLYGNPRNVYEAVGSRGEGLVAGLFGEPDATTHHCSIYQFSVAPWRSPELVWPNVRGRMFPTHRRWWNLVPAEGRIWTPSIYMGLVPFMLGLWAMRFRKGSCRTRWLTWLALFGLLGALGAYGIGWGIHELRYAMLGDQAGAPIVGYPVGGLYWLLVVCVPGYVYFRYPAKLMLLFALPVSLLAGKGLDRVVRRGAPPLAAVFGVFAAASGLLSVCCYLSRSQIIDWLRQAPADASFGPLVEHGAVADMTIAFLHAALVAAAAYWLLRRPGQRRGRWVVLLTAVDLTVAGSWMVATIPDAELASHDTVRPAIGRTYRTSQTAWVPPSWSQESSPDRLAEIAAWERATSLPKYALLDRVSLIESPGTLHSMDHVAVMQAGRRHGKLGDPDASFLRMIGVSQWIRPQRAISDQAGVQQDFTNVAATQRLTIPDSQPRAWLVHEVTILPAMTTITPAAVRARTEKAWYPRGRLRDSRREAVVECAAAPFTVSEPAGSEAVTILSDQPQRIEVDANLAAPGLLVLNDTYYAGWTAAVATAGRAPVEVEVVRTNRIMRGVFLPAGEHRVVFRYKPRGFFYGAWISAGSWLALLAASVVLWRGKHRRSGAKVTRSRPWTHSSARERR